MPGIRSGQERGLEGVIYSIVEQRFRRGQLLGLDNRRETIGSEIVALSHQVGDDGVVFVEKRTLSGKVRQFVQKNRTQAHTAYFLAPPWRFIRGGRGREQKIRAAQPHHAFEIGTEILGVIFIRIMSPYGELAEVEFTVPIGKEGHRSHLFRLDGLPDRGHRLGGCVLGRDLLPGQERSGDGDIQVRIRQAPFSSALHSHTAPPAWEMRRRAHRGTSPRFWRIRYISISMRIRS